MAKRLLKTMILPLTVMATALAFIACDGNTPDVKYHVTYVIGANAEGTAPTETDKAFGEKFKLKSADGITCEGATFGGWNDGNMTYQVGDTYTMPSKAVTFTAQWEPNGEPPATYSVTYDLNGGTGEVPAVSYKGASEKFNLASADGITNGDKEFDGWSDGTDKYDAGAEYTMSGKAVVFTAQWKDAVQPAAKYTVTYKYGDAGEDVVKNDQSAENYALEAPAKYMDTGNDEYYKLFAGWTVENGDGTVYLPDAKLTLTGDTVFEAQWVDFDDDNVWFDTTYELQLALLTDKVGTLILNLGGEDEENPNLAWTYFTYAVSGTAITVTPVVGNPATGTLDNGDLTISIKYGMTTYQFQPEEEPPVGKPTVTFNANGGTGTAPVIDDADIVATTNNQYNIVLPQCTYTAPANKEFDKWEVIIGSKSFGNYAAGFTFKANEGENLTLKAVWKEAQSQAPAGVVLYGNCTLPTKQGMGGMMQGGETVVQIVIDTTDPQNVKIKYMLADEVAYSNDKTGDGSAYAQYKPDVYGDDALYYGAFNIGDLSYNIVVKSDLTALWLCDTTDDDPLDNGEFTTTPSVPTMYTVTYNKPDDAEGTMAAVTAEEGSYTLAVCTYTKAGWDFLGWKDESLGFYDDPVVAAAGETVTLSKNMSYVAVFAKTYTNSEDANVTLDLRDDEYVLWNFGSYTEYLTWEQDGNHIGIYWGYETVAYLEIDGNTYIELDALAMPLYTFTTKDGNTTLTFDGKGHATLGSHQGTYEKIMESQGWYGDILVGVKLTFNATEYECYFEFDEDANPYLYTTIQVGGVEYEFDPYTAWYTITFEVDADVTGAPESPVQIHNSIGGDNRATVEFPDDYYMGKDGYLFAGWAVKNSDGTVGNTVNTYNYKVTEDTTFVAVWIEESFPVTYSAGDIGADATTGFDRTDTAWVNPNSLEGIILKLPTAAEVSRTGYTLKHWVIQGDDSGTPYAPGASNVHVTGPTVFVAVWEAETPNTGNEFTLNDLNGTTWTGSISFNYCDYDSASFENGVLSLYEDGYPDTFELTESVVDGKLVASNTKLNATVTLTFEDANHFTISYVKTGVGAATASGSFTRDGGSAPEGSDKIAYYIGESSNAVVKYGYSSEAAAGSSVITLSGAVYYGVEIYYANSKATVRVMGAGGNKACYVRVLNTSTTLTPDDNLNVVDTTFTLWGTAISTGGTISFTVENGKRQVTISDGTNSVTWTETA